MSVELRNSAKKRIEGHRDGARRDREDKYQKKERIEMHLSGSVRVWWDLRSCWNF